MNTNFFSKSAKWVAAAAVVVATALNASAVIVNVGTLPAGKSVRIVYSATINNSILVGSITNQTTVTGSNFSTVTSDDPETATSGDATVTTVSVPPVIGDFNKTSAEDATLTFSAADFTSHYADGNGDALQTIKITSLPANGTLKSNGVDVVVNQQIAASALGTLTYQPSTNYYGADSFNWNASDGSAYADSAAVVNLTITGVNDAPIGVNDLLTSIAEDSGVRTISIATLLANDSAGPNETNQMLTIIGVGNAVGGTVAISGTNVLFTPTANYNGAASFVYTNQDDGLTAGATDFKTSTATVSFNITEVNNSPVAVNDSLSSIAEDSGTRTIPFATLLANDSTGPTNEVGQTLTIIAVTNAVGGTATISGTDVLFALTTNFNGTASFDYTVQDNGTTAGVADPKSATASVSFIVTDVPDYDFGDAPASYGTLLADDGARHLIPYGGATLYLGLTPPDIEADGLPSSDALADNNSGSNDEDGVTLPVAFVTGNSSNLTVVATGSGFLNAWIDFNRNGNFSDAGEQVFTNVSLSAGTNVLSVVVPASISQGGSFARFRFGSQTNLAPTGVASDGEVEDYAVNLVANTPATVSCPSNITTTNAVGECLSPLVSFAASAGGLPAPTVTYEFGGNTITSPYAFPIGTNTVSVTASNGIGANATCSFLVVVNDTELPVINCPANIVKSNDLNQCGAVVSFSATASDNCSATVVSTPASGSFFPLGVTTVTNVATDASGNKSSCTFTVTVQDKQAPTMNCPSNIVTTNSPGQCGAVVTFVAGAQDSCGEVSVVSTPLSGSVFPVGVTTVNVVANDGNGNTNTCSFTVTVNDVQPPTFTTPPNIVVGKDAGVSGAVVTFPTPTAADNCSVASVTCSPVSGSFFSIGTTSVHCVATDAHGNTNAINFNVTVTTNEAPVLDAINNYAAVPTQSLHIPLHATDTNNDTITLSLDAGAPAGAAINGTTFSWTPTLAQASTTNAISIRATDNGVPSRSTTRTFTVVVGDYFNVILGQTNIEAGDIATVPITVTSSGSVKDLLFTVDLPANSFTNATLVSTAPETGVATAVYHTTNVVIHLQSAAGQLFTGTEHVADLQLGSVASQPSAQLALPISSVSASNAVSPYNNLFGGAGQVVVVLTQPVVQAFLSPSNVRSLLVYGKVGTSYDLQKTTSTSVPWIWTRATTYLQTNRVQSLDLNDTNPFSLYRVVKTGP